MVPARAPRFALLTRLFRGQSLVGNLEKLHRDRTLVGFEGRALPAARPAPFEGEAHLLCAIVTQHDDGALLPGFGGHLGVRHFAGPGPKALLVNRRLVEEAAFENDVRVAGDAHELANAA